MIPKDFLFALRLIQNRLGFYGFVILTLAIAIGANTALFSLLFGVVLEPFEYSESQNLARIWQTSPDWVTSKSDRVPVSFPNLQDWRAQNHVFEDLAAYAPRNLALFGEDRSLEVAAALVTENFFQLLRVVPQAGRVFSPSDYESIDANVAVISQGLSHDLFAESGKSIGKTIRIDGRELTVVGVLPQGFRWWFPATSGAGLKWVSTDLWIPHLPPKRLLRQSSYLQVIGRLKPGVKLEQARTEMTSIGEELRAAYPDTNGGVALESLQDSITNSFRGSFELLMAAALLILTATICNLAGLFVARASERRREVAVRLALGAGWRHLARQFLVESLVVAGLAGLTGVFLSHWLLGFLKSLIPSDVPRIDQAGANPATLAFAVSAAGLAAILLTLAPLIRVRSDRGHRHLVEDLNRYASYRRSRLLRALVAAEVGCTVALLAATGLALGTFADLKSVNLGLDDNDALCVRWVIPRSKYGTPQAQAQFVSSALAQTGARLGTSTIGVAGAAPFANWSTSTIVPETHTGPEENLPSARVNTISSGYFQALGVQLSAGRDFANQDDFASDPVSIVNQRVAELDFQGLDPLGRKLKVFSRWTRIVGVVGNARQASLTDDIPREVFLPVSQHGLLQMTVIARLTPDPSAPAQLIQTLRAIEPEAVLETPLRFQDLLSDLLQSPRVRSTVFSVLAAMAAIVSFVGVFGVVSNAVNGRSHEFGIRLALGATGNDLKREILLGNVRTIGLGIVFGLVLFAFLARLLSSQLFGLSAANPAILGLAIVAVTAIATLAAYLPSLGVSKIDPVAVLRRE